MSTADDGADGGGPGAVLHVSRSVRIPLAELQWRFTTSGGPGGQHANKASTRAEVVFDVAGSPSLGPYQRTRLLSRLGPVVRVAVSDDRSQARNRQLALDRLRDRLVEGLRVERTRRPTAPTKGAAERRLEAKRQQAMRKQGRRRPADDD